jgi:hypothetical protein
LSRTPIVLALASNAEADAMNRDSPRLGNLDPAICAVSQRRTLRQLTLNAADGVLHGRVDLILYGTVTGPTRSHVALRKT